jgi:formate hydrogenlyase subunit 6/NADH:ubiquinone oxidoreductase subunit I
MLNTLKNRYEQGCRTSTYPKTTITLPEDYCGLPMVSQDAPDEIAAQCAAACPQDAIDAQARSIDMGRCVFCGHCERLSGGQFVSFTRNFEISTAEKEHLITAGRFPDLAAAFPAAF